MNVASEYNEAGKFAIDSLPLVGASAAGRHANNYPNTIYAKGAVILGMLRDYLGDSLFFESIRTYGRAHAYSTADTHDLQKAFEQISKRDLDWFFQEFVYQRGAPDVSVAWSKTSKGASIQFTQWQDTLGYRYFRMPILVRASAGNRVKNIYVWMDSVRQSTALADFGFVPEVVTVNPLGDLLIHLSEP